MTLIALTIIFSYLEFALKQFSKKSRLSAKSFLLILNTSYIPLNVNRIRLSSIFTKLTMLDLGFEILLCALYVSLEFLNRTHESYFKQVHSIKSIMQFHSNVDKVCKNYKKIASNIAFEVVINFALLLFFQLIACSFKFSLFTIALPVGS